MHGQSSHLADGGGVLLAVEEVAADAVVDTSAALAIAANAAGVSSLVHIASGSRSTSTSTSGANIARPLQSHTPMSEERYKSS